MITGLCRCLRRFDIGNRYIFVTRLSPLAAQDLNVNIGDGPRYLGVASMFVDGTAPSHQRAADKFLSRRYVAAPSLTPYPPGLAHDPKPVAAVCRQGCIVHTAPEGNVLSVKKRIALIPERASEKDWQAAYGEYHSRQSEKHLGAAFCRIETIAGREALAMDFRTAPVFSEADWEGCRLNVMGRLVREETASILARRIAEVGALV